MGGAVSKESVFDRDGCVVSSRAVIKVRYAGGYVEEFEGPVTAQEVMELHARHWVARPDIFKTSKSHLSILPPHAQLLSGRTYFLVPYHTVYRRLLRESLPQQDLLSFLARQGLTLSKFRAQLKLDPGPSSHHSLNGATAGRRKRAKVSYGEQDFYSNNRDIFVMRKKAFTNRKARQKIQELLSIYQNHGANNDPPSLLLKDKKNSQAGSGDADILIKKASDYYAKYSYPELENGKPVNTEPGQDSNKSFENEEVMGHRNKFEYAESDQEGNKEMVKKEEQKAVKVPELRQGTYRTQGTQHLHEEINKNKDIQTTRINNHKDPKETLVSTEEQETFEATHERLREPSLELQDNDASNVDLGVKRRQLLMRSPFLQSSKTMQDHIELGTPLTHPPNLWRSKSVQNRVELGSFLTPPPFLQRSKSMQDHTEVKHIDQPGEPNRKQAANPTIGNKLQNKPWSLRDLMMQSSTLPIAQEEFHSSDGHMYNKISADKDQGSTVIAHPQTRAGASSNLERFTNLNQSPLNVNHLPHTRNSQPRLTLKYAMLLTNFHGRPSRGRFRSTWKPALQPVYESSSE